MESEYIALSEPVKHIIFIANMLVEVLIKIEKPVKVVFDNLPAIRMSNKVQSQKHSKHFDLRLHFIQDCVEEKKIEIQFISSSSSASQRSVPDFREREKRWDELKCGRTKSSC